jgi:hypothetical protein
MNQELSDNVLDNFYTQVLQEQTRLMGEMRNSPEKFKDNEVLHTHITSLMKSVLKFKAIREKIKNKRD